MKSALECFQHAAKCEEQAKQAISDAGRAVLLETANHWRRLGKQAEAKETSWRPACEGAPQMGQELEPRAVGCSLTLSMCALGGNVPPHGTRDDHRRLSPFQPRRRLPS